MKLLLDIEKFRDWANGEVDAFNERRQAQVCQYVKLDVESVDIVNIGPGADVMVFAVSLVASYELLKMGKEFVETLQWYKEQGKKLLSLVKRKEVVSLDQDAASLLAIKHVAEMVSAVQSIKLSNVMTVDTHDVSGTMQHPDRDIADSPYRYYVFHFVVNCEDIIVLGVTSSGIVETLKHFRFNPYMLEEVADE